MQALERLKDILKADVSSKSFLAVHNKVTIPNMPRMVMIMIALDRYTSGIEDIRRLKDSRENEMITLFREDFIKTEVTKLCLINREEAEILIETDRSLGAMKSDLIALKNDMPFPPPPKPDKKADDPEKLTYEKKPDTKKRPGPSNPSGKS